MGMTPRIPRNQFKKVQTESGKKEEDKKDDRNDSKMTQVSKISHMKVLVESTRTQSKIMRGINKEY